VAPKMSFLFGKIFIAPNERTSQKKTIGPTLSIGRDVLRKIGDWIFGGTEKNWWHCF
jgi:hypothetical protein